MMGKVFVAKTFPPECKEEMAGMVAETLEVGSGVLAMSNSTP